MDGLYLLHDKDGKPYFSLHCAFIHSIFPNTLKCCASCHNDDQEYYGYMLDGGFPIVEGDVCCGVLAVKRYAERWPVLIAKLLLACAALILEEAEHE